MNCKNFGDLVKQLRENNHMTQLQLSSLIGYSEKQLRRIEQNKCMPSVDLLHQLSKIYNLDLNHYYKISFNNLSIEAYNQFITLNNAIFANNVNVIKTLITEYENLPHFKYGENLQLILYGKALCSSLIDSDYHTSLDYCLKGLKVDYKNFTINNIETHTFSNVSYAIINCMSCNYLALNQASIALKINLSLIKNIETFILNLSYPLYRSTEYCSKLYQVALYNTANLYVDEGEYLTALHYTEIGIEFSIKNNIIRFLPDLYFIKFKANYYLGNYADAKELYTYTLMLFHITNNIEKANKLKERLLTEFKNII